MAQDGAVEGSHPQIAGYLRANDFRLGANLQLVAWRASDIRLINNQLIGSTRVRPHSLNVLINLHHNY